MKMDKKAYRVLVIEDNPGDFVIVEQFIEEQVLNPHIVQAGSFKQASAILADTSFDVILLDLSLPDKSGEDLISKMLEVAASCPIIILTGFADIEFSIKSISNGIMDYLFKDDLNPPVLYKSIVYAIERRKSEYELRQSEKRYSDIFHLSPQPMWIFDTESFRFVQVNKATTQLYGYTEAEFMEMTLMDIKPEEDVLKSRQAIRDDIHDLNAAHEGIYFHYTKSRQILEMEICSSGIAIENKMYRLAIGNDVTEKNQHEHNIIKAIIKTQEDERYEIGSELHDNVCQILATSQIRLSMLKESVVASGQQMLNQCKDDILLASKEIRKLSHILAPAFYDFTTLEEEFTTALRAFNIENKYKVVVSFDADVKNHDINLPARQNLYRILQEQLGNIQKHADCTLIEVQAIIQNDETLRLTISDNGAGFCTLTANRGIGLANMKRRVALLSGRFAIESSAGNGCRIIISIPLAQMI
jgi:PAS domain S-box-containing protein